MLRLSLRVFSRVRSARPSYWSAFFFFNDTATTEIYTLSLHDALPIFAQPHGMVLRDRARSGPARSPARALVAGPRSEEHTSELQSLAYLVCRLLLEKKKNQLITHPRFQASISNARLPERSEVIRKLAT